MRSIQYLLLLLIVAIGAYFVAKYAIVDPEEVQNRKARQIAFSHDDETPAFNQKLEAEITALKKPTEEESLNLLHDISLLVMRITQFSDKLFSTQYIDGKEILSAFKMLEATSKLAPERVDLKKNIEQYRGAIEYGALDEQVPMDVATIKPFAKEVMSFYQENVFPFYTLIINELMKDLSSFNETLETGYVALDTLERAEPYLEEYQHRLELINENDVKLTNTLIEAMNLVAFAPDPVSLLEMETSLCNAQNILETIQNDAQFIESNFFKKIQTPAQNVRTIMMIRKQLITLPDVLILCQRLALCVSHAVKSYTTAATLALEVEHPEVYPAENLSGLNRKMVEQCKELTAKLGQQKTKSLMTREDKLKTFLESWDLYLNKSIVSNRRYFFLKEELESARKEGYTPGVLDAKYELPTIIKKKKHIITVFDQSTMRPLQTAKISINQDEKIVFKPIPNTNSFYAFLTIDTRPYIIDVKVQGYEDGKLTIQVKDNGKTEILSNIYVDPIKMKVVQDKISLEVGEDTMFMLRREQLMWRRIQGMLKDQNEKRLDAEAIHFHRIDAIKNGFKPQLDYNGIMEISE